MSGLTRLSQFVSRNGKLMVNSIFMVLYTAKKKTRIYTIYVVLAAVRCTTGVM